MKHVWSIAFLIATTFAEDKKQIEPFVTLKADGGEVTCIGFSSDGRSFYSGALDSYVSIWTTKDWKRSASIAPSAPPKANPGEHQDEFRSLDACVSGPRTPSVLIASGGDLVAEYSLPSGKLKSSHRLAAWSLAVSPDGTELAIAKQSKIAVLASGTWVKRKTFTASGRVKTLHYAPKGTLLAVGVEDHGVELWETRSQTRVRTFATDDRPEQMSFSADGQRLAAAVSRLRRNGRVVIWNVPIGIQEIELTGHAESPWSVAFSPDGRFLVSADPSPALNVKMWRVGDWKECLQLKAAGGYQVAISPDAHWLAAGGGTLEISVWDFRSLVQMCR